VKRLTVDCSAAAAADDDDDDLSFMKMVSKWTHTNRTTFSEHNMQGYFPSKNIKIKI
jgi:hypothetical protein